MAFGLDSSSFSDTNDNKKDIHPDVFFVGLLFLFCCWTRKAAFSQNSEQGKGSLKSGSRKWTDFRFNHE